MSNKFIEIVSGFILGMVLFYCAFSFINLSFNPNNWGEGGRLAYIMISMPISVAITFSIIQSDDYKQRYK